MRRRSFILACLFCLFSLMIISSCDQANRVSSTLVTGETGTPSPQPTPFRTENSHSLKETVFAQARQTPSPIRTLNELIHPSSGMIYVMVFQGAFAALFLVLGGALIHKYQRIQVTRRVFVLGRGMIHGPDALRVSKDFLIGGVCFLLMGCLSLGVGALLYLLK